MAVVTKEELLLYCSLDESDPRALLAIELGETNEARLIRKGCVRNSSTIADFTLAVKMMTLHDLDCPGQPYPQGIQQTINELKLGKYRGA